MSGEIPHPSDNLNPKIAAMNSAERNRDTNPIYATNCDVFADAYDRLVEESLGKFVAICEGQLLGTFETDSEAEFNLILKHGLKPGIIRQISLEEPAPVAIFSPLSIS